MSTGSQNLIKVENQRLRLQDRNLILKQGNIKAKLSKNQNILILCLMNDIIEKEKIIHQVWGGNNTHSKEKNYNQLVFQTRLLLSKNGFPDDLIMTIHRYGLCFNKFFITSPSDNDENVSIRQTFSSAEIQL